jgi:hypothetical protein
MTLSPKFLVTSPPSFPPTILVEASTFSLGSPGIQSQSASTPVHAAASVAFVGFGVPLAAPRLWSLTDSAPSFAEERRKVLNDLDFVENLSEKGYERIRIWKNKRGTRFYDCFCGGRKPRRAF